MKKDNFRKFIQNSANFKVLKMNRFTRNVAILIIDGERLVYIRDRDADIATIEDEMGAIIFRDGQPNVSVSSGKRK